MIEYTRAKACMHAIGFTAEQFDVLCDEHFSPWIPERETRKRAADLVVQYTYCSTEVIEEMMKIDEFAAMVGRLLTVEFNNLDEDAGIMRSTHYTVCSELVKYCVAMSDYYTFTGEEDY